MSNYLEQIKSLVRELENHPNISIRSFKTFPPIEHSTLETIQKKLGHSLNEDLTTFFLETNGLFLAWRFCLNKPKNVREKSSFTSRDNLDGLIQIPSLTTIFNHPKLLLDNYLSYEHLHLIKEQDKYKLSLVIHNKSRYSLDFDTYFNRTIASKGMLAERRNLFLSDSYSNATILLDEAAIHHLFNQSANEGADTSRLQTTLMQQHASQNKTISQQELKAIEEAHHQFLANGGAGGRWTTYEVGGFVFGVYLGKSSKEGIQANLEKRNLSSNSLDTCELQLPFATFCGAYGKYQDFSDSDFSYSLFTDSNLEKAIFADANLMHSDFSRANMREVSFMNANLTGCDFENCDLTGADFRGANWKGAKFPGAILKNIKY